MNLSVFFFNVYAYTLVCSKVACLFSKEQRASAVVMMAYAMCLCSVVVDQVEISTAGAKDFVVVEESGTLSPCADESQMHYSFMLFSRYMFLAIFCS